MKPGESWEGFLLTEPSSVGLLLLDGASLRPLHVNREAIDILTYPDTPANKKSLEDFLVRKIQALARPSPGHSGFVSHFVSGRRTYRCRVLPLNSDSLNGESILALLVERRPHLSLDSRRIAERFNLTEREMQTMEFLVQGFTSKEIADRMRISPNTVKAFVRLIMVKTGTSTRSGIVGKILRLKSRSA
jgi:DNA-binding CsgD family transcriptional regulator